jgi:hypothetical protein
MLVPHALYDLAVKPFKTGESLGVCPILPPYILGAVRVREKIRTPKYFSRTKFASK